LIERRGKAVVIARAWPGRRAFSLKFQLQRHSSRCTAFSEAAFAPRFHGLRCISLCTCAESPPGLSASLATAHRECSSHCHPELGNDCGAAGAGLMVIAVHSCEARMRDAGRAVSRVSRPRRTARSCRLRGRRRGARRCSAHSCGIARRSEKSALLVVVTRRRRGLGPHASFNPLRAASDIVSLPLSIPADRALIRSSFGDVPTLRDSHSSLDGPGKTPGTAWTSCSRTSFGKTVFHSYPGGIWILPQENPD